MATRRSSFEKRERDKNKKARAAAKREKRQDRSDEPGETSEGSPAVTPAGDQQAVFDALARLHADYDDGRVSFDDFEERRAELLSRLEI